VDDEEWLEEARAALIAAVEPQLVGFLRAVQAR